MNIELDELVVPDVSDDALELAAGSALVAGGTYIYPCPPPSFAFC